MSKIKVGDLVMVRSGKWRTKTGAVKRIWPEEGKAIVEGVNIQKKHQKKSQQNPQGGIIERPAPINLSKLMVIDPKSKKPSRVHWQLSGATKQRVVKSGEVLNATATNKEAKTEKKSNK